MAYIISGEWWHLQVALGQGAWMASYKGYDWRRYSLGIFTPEEQPRYYAWPVRDIGYAALIAPDGSPEQAYFQYVFNQNLAYWEGAFNVTKGRFFSNPTSNPPAYNTDNSPWFLGRFGSIGMGTKNPLAIVRGFREFAGGSGERDTNVVANNNYGTCFMNWFLLNVYGFFSHAGIGSTELSEAMAGYPIVQTVGSPTKYPPYLTQCYGCSGIPSNLPSPKLTAGVSGSSMVFPVDMIPDWWEPPMTVFIGDGDVWCNGEYIRICSVDRNANTVTVCSGGRGFGASYCAGVLSHNTNDVLKAMYPFQSAADLATGFTSTYFDAAAVRTNYTGDNGFTWGDDSYAGYTMAAIALHFPYTVQGSTGKVAWDFIKGKWDAMAQTGYNGKFLYAPYMDPVKVRATMGGTFVILEYTKPRSDEACTVNSVGDGVTASRLVRFVKTGLTAGSSGSLTIACASDPYGNTVVPYTTLSALSGTGSYSWTAPGGNTRLNYGATSALGTSTAFADCSAGCTVAPAKGLLYVQIERAGGAAGEIRPVLIP
jgi:hypothetical protein